MSGKYTTNDIKLDEGIDCEQTPCGASQHLIRIFLQELLDGSGDWGRVWRCVWELYIENSLTPEELVIKHKVTGTEALIAYEIKTSLVWRMNAGIEPPGLKFHPRQQVPIENRHIKDVWARARMW